MTDAAPVDPFAPADLGPVRLRNRFIKAATFEGMAKRGLVTDRLVDFHRTMAAGGLGMTTLAYLAVSPDGQGAPAEIVVRPEAVDGLARLADAVHEEGAAVSAQLGHAGPVAAGTGHTGLAPSRIFSPMAMRFTKAVTEGDIARITDDFGTAAGLLAQAGFDAVEVHLGHGYLPSSFLAPGSTAGPTVGAVRSRTGPRSPARSSGPCATLRAGTWPCSPS
jgi:2,4-dienoyl-CoA reductase-like NADH-dependent reductase (Old Yellow Enzyme family)